MKVGELLSHPRSGRHPNRVIVFNLENLRFFGNNLPDELTKSYEDRIEHLEKEVLFLRGLLAKG